jgi:hypothetical protein
VVTPASTNQATEVQMKMKPMAIRRAIIVFSLLEFSTGR